MPALAASCSRACSLIARQLAWDKINRVCRCLGCSLCRRLHVCSAGLLHSLVGRETGCCEAQHRLHGGQQKTHQPSAAAAAVCALALQQGTICIFHLSGRNLPVKQPHPRRCSVPLTTMSHRSCTRAVSPACGPAGGAWVVGRLVKHRVHAAVAQPSPAVGELLWRHCCCGGHTAAGRCCCCCCNCRCSGLHKLCASFTVLLGLLLAVSSRTRPVSV